MSNGDLYFSANEQLRLDDLVPITKELYKSLNKDYWDEEYQNLSYEKWKALLKEQGYDIKKIKKNQNPSSMRQFFYVGDYSAVEIQSLDPSWLLNPFTIGCLKADELRKKQFVEKDYTMYFFPEWNTFALDFFIRLYKEIDEEMLWEAFKTMYTYANYGFDMFPEEVLEYVFSYADNKESVKALELAGKIDSDGFVMVYRGEGERSTPVQMALSWTISKEVAERFAHFYGEGTVYQGKVKAENIIDYNNDRNEEEIIVQYKNVEQIEMIG